MYIIYMPKRINATSVSSGTLTLSTGLTSASARITNISTNSIIIDNGNISNGIQIGVGTGSTTSNLNLYGSFTDGYAIIQVGSTNNNSPNLKIVRNATVNGTIANFHVYSQTSAFLGGSVGVGTTSPGNTLDVSGTIRASTSLTTGALFSTNLTSTNIVATNLSAGTLAFNNINVSTVTIGSNLLAIGNSNTLGSIITTGGNVGIGTTSPVGILNVRDTTDFVGDDGGAFYITGGTNGNRRLHMGYVNTGNYGWIEAVEKGVNLTNLSLQPRGGNVGIGVGSSIPVSTLSIFTSNNLAGNTESGQNGLSIQTGTSAASDMILYMGADKTNKVSYIQSVLWGAVTNPLILNARGGNVGISNTAPTHLLSVGIAPNGTNTKGSISINTSGESRYHLFNYAGVAEWLFGQKTLSRSDFTFSKLVAGTETDYLTISTGGSVGIGTTAPARPLHVQGAARLGGSGPALDFGDDFTTQIYRNGTTSEMRFNTNSLERITITSTGNVGIGTLSPTSLLHVVGPSGTGSNGSTLITGRDSFGHTLYIDSYANARRLAFNNNGTVGNIFAYNYGGSVAQNLVLQGPGGNVGIGTASPGSKLHVVGSTRTDSIEMNAGGGAKQFASGTQAGGADRGTTNFPFTFANVPIVVASIRQDIGDTVYDVQIVSVSTTGFTYRKTFYRFGGGYGGSAVSEEFNWIAMG